MATIETISVERAEVDPVTGDVEEVGCVGVFTDDFLDLLFPEWEQGNYTIAAKVSDGVLTVTLENDTI